MSEVCTKTRQLSLFVRSSGQPGKCVALVGGVHGNEFYGSAVVMVLVERLHNASVTGEVIVVAGAENIFSALAAGPVNQGYQARGSRGCRRLRCADMMCADACVHFNPLKRSETAGLLGTTNVLLFQLEISSRDWIHS